MGLPPPFHDSGAEAAGCVPRGIDRYYGVDCEFGVATLL